MFKSENHQNWGINDYCKTVTQDLIASTLATWGPNVVTYKPLLEALKFTEIEAQQLSLQPSSRISTMAQKILFFQGILSQFKLLMERGYLRGAFPTNTEFDFGYPKLVPHRLILAPQTSQALNFKVVIQMFMGSYPTLVSWLASTLIKKILENSKILKKDKSLIFDEIARQEKIQVQVHHSVFPDRSPTVYGQDFSKGSTFFLNIWYVLEHRELYHLIQIDYLSARQLSYMQSHKITWSSAECIDYSQYLNKKKIWEEKFLSVVSFNGIDPFNWMQEKQQGLIDPYSRASETKDNDVVAFSYVVRDGTNLADSQLNLDCSRISQQSSILPVEQRIISDYQNQIGRLKEELELVQQQNQNKLSGIQLTSPSKPIQLLKIGMTVSYIINRVIKDEDIESIVDGQDSFIFIFRSGETFKIDKSILKDSVLSQEVGRLMGQVPPLIEQVGAILFEGINQSLSIDECCQFALPSKKIKKDQKNQDKLNKSNKKNPKGGRGQKKN